MAVLFRFFKDNLAKCFFLVLLSTIISALGLFCVNNYLALHQCLEVYKAYGLDKGILFKTDLGFPSSAERKRILDSINSLENVESAEFLKDITGTIAAVDDSFIYLIDIDENVSSIPWKVTNGRMINRSSSNEICLSSNFSNEYSVGDELDVVLYADCVDGNEVHNTKLKVVGFFDIDSYMPYDMGTFRYELRTWSGNPTAYAFTCNLCTDEGLEIVYSDSDLIFIIPHGKNSSGEIENQVASIVGRGKGFDYSEYKEFVYYRNKTTNEMINVTGISLFVLMIAVFSAFTVIQLSINRQELLVYYVNGCTWKKAVGIACFSYLPLMVVGMLLGVVAYLKVPIFSIMTNGDYVWDIRAFWIVSSTMIIVFLALCGFFYAITYRESAVESMRGD